MQEYWNTKLRKIPRSAYRIALYTLAFMLAMHAANFFWLAYSHDSLDFIASYSERNWQISIGRYVQPVYWSIRGKIAAPLIVGLMSYLWLVPAVCIAADMFQLKSEVSRCL